jgi:hypothetical protein
VKVVSKIVVLSLMIFPLASFQNCAFGEPQPNKDRPVAVPAGTNPERIILTWNSDPAASQAVTWRTEQPCAESFAQIAPAAPEPNFGIKAIAVPSINEAVQRENHTPVYYHTVTFQNLSPSTLYAYRVGNGVAFSEWNLFKTADAGHKPFSFIYFGDEQNDIKSQCSRVIRQAYSMAPNAHFIVHAGDLVSLADCDEQWDEWFDAAGWIYRVVPSVPIIGNHEQPDVNTPDDNAGLSRFWRPQFALPLNGPADQNEIVYYLDYQGVRFIALNGSKCLDEQSKWLEPVLANNPNRWTIVVMHQPMFPTAKDRDGIETRKAFESLFDKYHVDVVLQGHDHTYGRTHKVNADKAVGNADSGTVYCISVSGPKQYKWNPTYETLMAKKTANTQMFQIISVSSEKLTYNAYTANQDLYDHFELTKSADGRSVLSE